MKRVEHCALRPNRSTASKNESRFVHSRGWPERSRSDCGSRPAIERSEPRKGVSMPESITARPEQAPGGSATRERGATPLRGRITSARSDLASLDRRTRVVAKDHPFLALGAALLTGYVVGRVVSRL